MTTNAPSLASRSYDGSTSSAGKSHSSSSSSGRKSKKKEKSSATPNSKWTLTGEERMWAEALQSAIERERPPLGPVSDLEVAQHAIVAKSKTHKALNRIKRLQQFKRTYGIRSDTNVYEALTIIHHFLDVHPNFLSSFGKNVTNGQHVLAFRFGEINSNQTHSSSIGAAPAANTNSSNANSQNNKRSIMSEQDRFQALYYIFHALQPDLEAIRAGTVWICHLDSLTRDTFTMGLIRGGRALCRDAYPIRVVDCPCLSPPIVVKALYGICKPFLSQKVKDVMHIEPDNASYIRKTIRLENQIPKNILHPNLGGVQRSIDTLEELEDALKRRFETAQSFRL